MARAKQPPQIHQLTVAQFEKMFPDEEACKVYLHARRWPDGVRCPRCGNPAVYDLATRKWHWQCHECAPSGYRFSVIAGTIFENTKKPLRDWYRVIHLMLTSKKGMSARQVWRYMGFGSLETAWYMCHRVRVALMEDIDKLGGIVEVDETFVGGLAKNRHWDKRGGGGGTGGIGSGKTPIVGAVSRKGNVVARVVANVNSATLTAFVREAVSHRVSLLCTDQYPGYNPLDMDYPHMTIDHARGQYVIGAILKADGIQSSGMYQQTPMTEVAATEMEYKLIKYTNNCIVESNLSAYNDGAGIAIYGTHDNTTDLNVVNWNQAGFSGGSIDYER